MGGHDEPSNVFGNLRDDGVAEGSKSVHPLGNPMSHSTHVGFSCPPMASGSRAATAFSRFWGWPSGRRQTLWLRGLPISARGVGHIAAQSFRFQPP
jgi:hypothetical protein